MTTAYSFGHTCLLYYSVDLCSSKGAELPAYICRCCGRACYRLRHLPAGQCRCLRSRVDKAQEREVRGAGGRARDGI